MTWFQKNESFVFWTVMTAANACTIFIGEALEMHLLSAYGFVMVLYCSFFASRCLPVIDDPPLH